MTLLEVSGLSVSLGRARVLDDVSLGVETGGWTAVVGPNGAGKSTLLRAVAGLVGYRGTVRVAGADAAALPARPRPADRLRGRRCR